MVVMSLQEKIALTDYNVNIPCHVTVTWVHHPSYFFVRPAVITEYDLNVLTVPGKLVPRNELVVDKLVIYYSSTKQKMIRGQIQKKMDLGYPATFLIFAIDYGFYDISVAYSAIYNWARDPNVGPLAAPCRLIDCHPNGNTTIWSYEVIKAFQSAIDSQATFLIQIQSLSTTHMWVDLYTHKLLNIGKWLIENDMATNNLWCERRSQ